MSQFDAEIRGLPQLQAAVRRNPRKVVTEVGKFLQRGMAAYNRKINRKPWKMGMMGGGAPVDTGNLRDTHQRDIRPFEARIYPTAPYAAYVHGIAGHPRTRTYQLRPWLDWAKDQADKEIRGLEQNMLTAIVSDLAK